ncbi:MAG: hypothetical protein PHC30_05630 [Lentisphaeria bacterium]|nr:hypothetical protein [Lentisphaeria bacterium]
MNKMSWFGLAALLAGGAVFSTSAMRRMSQPLPPFVSRYDAAAEESGKAVRPAGDEARAAARPATPAVELALDDLWEKSLFHNERTEKNAGASEPQEPEAPVKSEFELVGIARIGDPEHARAIAIIKQEQAPSRNAQLAAARARMIRSRTTRAAPAPQPEPEEAPKKPLKKMFRVGDAVNESGYVVKSIDPATNTVILSKGSEEITLRIELADKQSSTRRQTAVNQELAVREKYKAAETAASGAAAAPASADSSAAPPAAAAAAGPAGTPPPPPGGFATRPVRTNPNAPGAAAPGAEPAASPASAAGGGASGGAATPAVNNPMVNRLRQSNRPTQGRTTQPQPQSQP